MASSSSPSPSAFWNDPADATANATANATATAMLISQATAASQQSPLSQPSQSQSQSPSPPPPPPPNNNNNNSNKRKNNSNSRHQVDRVNGIGMWNAWTRSFDTPMLALLDLFDNAVDASLTLVETTKKTHMQRNSQPQGSIGQQQQQQQQKQEHQHQHQQQQQHQHQHQHQRPRIQIHLDEIGQHGVVLRNSCLHTLPPMEEVLEVYKSSKTNNPKDIGENGIGVKHACANLSPLSILLTKTADEYGIGILMEDLQRQEGIVLPSFQLPVEEEDNINTNIKININININNNFDMEQRLLQKANAQKETWGKAIAQYGDSSVELGVDRILRHFDEMIRGKDWKEYDNVFTVILTQLRHEALGGEDEEEQHQDDEQLTALQEITGDNAPERSLGLLKELRDKLPMLYIHIHSLEVSVQHQVIDSLYWEKRLVEVTTFNATINPIKHWKRDADILDATETSVTNPKTIRFFLGFDVYRSQKKKENVLHLYIYSRESGRLIKVEEDPRSKLSLSSGSTQFKQGMTVILDDHHGTLPLNPTKQDTSFGASNHGRSHYANLMEWTGAITNFYWNHHQDRVGGHKSQLTAAVIATIPSLEALFLPPDESSNTATTNNNCAAKNATKAITTVPPLAQGHYSTFPKLTWRLWQRERIRARDGKKAVPLLGSNSLIRLVPLPPPPPAPPKPEPKPRPRLKPEPEPEPQPAFVPSFNVARVARAAAAVAAATPTRGGVKRKQIAPRRRQGGDAARQITDAIYNEDELAPEIEDEGYDNHGHPIYKPTATAMNSRKRRAIDPGAVEIINIDSDSDDENEDNGDKKENDNNLRQTLKQAVKESIKFRQKAERLKQDLERAEEEKEQAIQLAARRKVALDDARQALKTANRLSSSSQQHGDDDQQQQISRWQKELKKTKNENKLYQKQLEQKNRKISVLEEEVSILENHRKNVKDDDDDDDDEDNFDV